MNHGDPGAGSARRLVLLVVGWLIGLGILETIGIILLAVGLVFLLVGGLGYPVGGRRYWY